MPCPIHLRAFITIQNFKEKKHMAASMAASMQLCSSNLTHHPNQNSSSSIKVSNNSSNLHGLSFNRRKAIASALSATFIAGEASWNRNAAAAAAAASSSAIDLRFTVPDQTVEEAEGAIKGHAQDLLQIKALVDSESWREAQFALRESSAYLKQDLYTIIQAKPASQRAPLRKLYSALFNNVSKLDYAARNKDADVVKECYSNIAATLVEILSKI